MTNPVEYLNDFMAGLPTEKPPVGIVVRSDIYSRLEAGFFCSPQTDKLVLPNSIPVFCDPAASVLLLAQTEECMLFYEYKSLSIYLERAKDPIAWIKHCCECANIPYPEENDPGRQMPFTTSFECKHDSHLWY